MKDLRPQRDPRDLAPQRRGATVRPGDDSGEEVRRARRRHRWSAGLLIAGVLTLVMAPHLIDSTRVSSVADRAAAQAGGPAPLSLGCPQSAAYPDVVNPPLPVTIERAVICHYPGGAVDQPAAMAVVAPTQLPLLNADLQANSRRAARAAASGAVLEVPGRRSEAWVIFGVTRLGQRVALTGTAFPARFRWSGVGQDRVWRPSPAVQQMLAADLPS